MAHSRLGTLSFGFDGPPKKLLRIYTTHSIVGILGLVGLTVVTSLGRDMVSDQEGTIAKAVGVLLFIPFILLRLNCLVSDGPA